MRFRYLVGGYVEALGLEVVPILKARDSRVYCCPEHAPAEQRIVEGVEFEGRLYQREVGYSSFVHLPSYRDEELVGL